MGSLKIAKLCALSKARLRRLVAGAASTPDTTPGWPDVSLEASINV